VEEEHVYDHPDSWRVEGVQAIEIAIQTFGG
jgi:hypothetical protein